MTSRMVNMAVAAVVTFVLFYFLAGRENWSVPLFCTGIVVIYGLIGLIGERWNMGTFKWLHRHDIFFYPVMIILLGWIWWLIRWLI